MMLGDIIFIGDDSWISKLIQKYTDCPYSHVAIYIGNDKIIEADYLGVIISDIAKYNHCRLARFSLHVAHADLYKFIDFVLTQYNRKYDYSLLLGYLLVFTFNACKKYLGFFNCSDRWLCSELVAAGMEHVNIKLPKSPQNMTPKDIYDFLKGQNYGEQQKNSKKM